MSASLRYIFACLALTVLVGCSSDSDTRPSDASPYATEAVARAREDAFRAIEAPEGSMSRENAILDIHARAHRLELTGDSATARVYLDTAIATLDSAGVFAPKSDAESDLEGKK